MSKILRFGALLCVLFFGVNSAFAAGYSCPTYKKYTSCASGYYMTSSSSSNVCNTTATAGNACRPCSAYGSNYTCAGGTACPKVNSVTCSAGYYLKANATSCTQCEAGYACTGGTYNISSSIQGRTQCTGATYAGAGASSCSSCPSGYTANTTAGKTASSQCTISVAAGKYVGTKNSSTLSTCAAGTYKAAHTVSYGSTSSCSACTGATYSGSGAGSCSSCPSGYTANTSSNKTSASQCQISVSGGKYIGTANSATMSTCSAGTYKAAHTVNYGSTSSCSSCTGATYSGSGASSCSSCPSGYTANTSSGKTAASQCTISVGAGKYVGTANSATLSTCAAGKYKAAHTVNYGSTSSCSTCSAGTYSSAGAGSCTACSGSTQYQDATGQSSCKTVSSGYYKSSNSAQAQCPSGYRDGAGAANQNSCIGNFTKTGSQVNGSVPTNCSAVTSWNSCTPGTCTYKKNYAGTITSDCTPSNCTKTVAAVTAKAGYYDAGTTCTACPSGYPNSDAGNEGGITKCYSNSKSRAWTGSQVNGSVPTNCAAVTSWNACSIDACSYVAYSNSAGTGDGTVKSGCSTNSANCTKTVAAVSAKAGYYDAGTTCSACPSGYPNSDASNEGGITKCYSNSKSRAWTGSQVNGSVPTNCASVTAWNACSIDSCSYVAYSNSAGTGDGTVKSGCSTNSANCTKTPKTVTAKVDSYVDGTSCKTCSSFSSTYTKSDGGSISNAYCYVTKTKTGSQVNGSVPTNCSAVTSWNACTPGTCTYKDYYSATDTTCTPSNCTKTVAAVTAKAGYYDAGTTCTACPSGYPNSDAGNDGGVTKCYSNTRNRSWTGSQVNGSVPTNCAAVTTWNSCSLPSCTYTVYANSAGTGDGTLRDGCSTNNANCTKTVAAVSAKAGYYDAGTTCSACPSGYPNSDAENEGGITKCYSNTKSRAWTGSQTACALPTGCESKTCNSCSNPACDYVAYSNSAGTGDGTIKSGCSTNAAACQQTVKSVTASKGRYVSGLTCPACAAGTYQGTAGSTATSCAVCGGATYAAGTGAAACTACPTSYSISGTTAADHDAKSDCKISCEAGTQVATADAACTTPTGSWYTAAHTVAAGSTSGSNIKACLTNYSTPSTTTATDHDASTDCKISCAAGTQIASANATSCTTPSGNWYVGAHSVAQGSKSTVNNCLVNYSISGTAAANHDAEGDCKISCGGGTYIAAARNTTCTNVGAGYWAAASTVSQGSAGVRNACEDNMTTIGYGAGADEAGDCGRILNVGDSKIYLRSEKKTTPSLNVGINGTTYYGNMGTATKGTLRIKSGSTTYSVYDESM